RLDQQFPKSLLYVFRRRVHGQQNGRVFAAGLNGSGHGVGGSLPRSFEQIDLGRRDDSQVRFPENLAESGAKLLQSHELGASGASTRIGKHLKTIGVQIDPPFISSRGGEQDSEKQEHAGHYATLGNRFERRMS